MFSVLNLFLLGVSQIASYFKTANNFATKFGVVKDRVLKELNTPQQAHPIDSNTNQKMLMTRIQNDKGLFKVLEIWG